ncbi:dihydrolipoyllysine-residue acetyltransferase [Paraferrimonas sedimenticola]|uniref:Acetyltransferase component of pyruvate dehydrogenase complex n=1 Tax=Paraferrimonas sedimenticola TaxID=375674 RepID=A0AA37RZ22_9GAMM|nr:dihydrolipoyllysine-residue acetyltransferase [Paraferrimonas sedimenticola]GLP97457.1 acetyltransferase component of pyruvate dehydrogenase complex [Paraferrimonas sedimenticola]
MSDIKQILVPDIGGDQVEVIELCVAVGDTVEAEASIITVESDKATMDIPAPEAGVIKELKVAVGDKVEEGTLIAMIQAVAGAESPEEAPAPAVGEAAPAPEAESTPVESAPVESATATTESSVVDIVVPDIGEDGEVDIIEVLVAAGDNVEADQGLITLETDKATMEVPASQGGKVVNLTVSVGDKVGSGAVIGTMSVQGAAPAAPAAVATDAPAPAPAEAPRAAPAPSAPPVPHHPSAGATKKTGMPHASPAVRRLAREFGVDLNKVTGTGRKNRILKEDVQSWVKYELSRPKSSAVEGGSGLNVIEAPKVDFAKFGEVEEVALTRIQKISGPSLHRNWVTIPHVTQFDEADITELEAFRKEQNQMLNKQKADFKITPLVFMMKAVAKALAQYPVFNSSLSPDGESLIMKKYFHIGIAVDTPNGLVVPVVRDVDKKGIYDLSKELLEISAKAREGKLKAQDMQGSCFTISSLGGIGGTAFTPIVNYPDVAILGVSKSEMKPKWDGAAFQPRLMLPLSLSYDHRVIDGAVAARFSVALASILTDIRKLIL